MNEKGSGIGCFMVILAVILLIALVIYVGVDLSPFFSQVPTTGAGPSAEGIDIFRKLLGF